MNYTNEFFISYTRGNFKKLTKQSDYLKNPYMPRCEQSRKTFLKN